MPASAGLPGPGERIVDRDFIVSHHLDLRVDTSDELVKVIGKTVVIINQ